MDDFFSVPPSYIPSFGPLSDKTPQSPPSVMPECESEGPRDAAAAADAPDGDRSPSGAGAEPQDATRTSGTEAVAVVEDASLEAVELMMSPDGQAGEVERGVGEAERGVEEAARGVEEAERGAEEAEEPREIAVAEVVAERNASETAGLGAGGTQVEEGTTVPSSDLAADGDDHRGPGVSAQAADTAAVCDDGPDDNTRAGDRADDDDAVGAAQRSERNASDEVEVDISLSVPLKEEESSVMAKAIASQHTVRELKEMCRLKQLSTFGKKIELAMRLTAAAQSSEEEILVVE